MATSFTLGIAVWLITLAFWNGWVEALVRETEENSARYDQYELVVNMTNTAEAHRLIENWEAQLNQGGGPYPTIIKEEMMPTNDIMGIIFSDRAMSVFRLENLDDQEESWTTIYPIRMEILASQLVNVYVGGNEEDSENRPLLYAPQDAWRELGEPSHVWVFTGQVRATPQGVLPRLRRFEVVPSTFSRGVMWAPNPQAVRILNRMRNSSDLSGVSMNASWRLEGLDVEGLDAWVRQHMTDAGNVQLAGENGSVLVDIRLSIATATAQSILVDKMMTIEATTQFKVLMKGLIIGAFGLLSFWMAKTWVNQKSRDLTVLLTLGWSVPQLMLGVLFLISMVWVMSLLTGLACAWAGLEFGQWFMAKDWGIRLLDFQPRFVFGEAALSLMGMLSAALIGAGLSAWKVCRTSPAKVFAEGEVA